MITYKFQGSLVKFVFVPEIITEQPYLYNWRVTPGNCCNRKVEQSQESVERQWNDF